MDNREIDVLIAEKMMGFHKYRVTTSKPKEFGLMWFHPDKPFRGGRPELIEDDQEYDILPETYSLVPNYSTDISAAWQVAEMLEHRFGCDVNTEIRRKSMNKVWTGERWERKRYYVTISGGKLGYDNFNCSFTIYDDSPCLAICLAALKAIESEVEEEKD